MLRGFWLALLGLAIIGGSVVAAALTTLRVSDPPPIEFGWSITNFDANYAIQADGSIDVTEQIAVDFQDLQRHGIYRDIVVLQDCDSTN